MKTCCYCGRESGPGVNMTREHIIPLSKGGNHHASNIRSCCLRCNRHRGNKELTEWQYELALMIKRLDFSLFTLCEIKNVIINIGRIRREVLNSTPEMWYSGKVGVIETGRKIKSYR
jgi:hypothetical protein